MRGCVFAAVQLRPSSYFPNALRAHNSLCRPPNIITRFFSPKLSAKAIRFALQSHTKVNLELLRELDSGLEQLLLAELLTWRVFL